MWIMNSTCDMFIHKLSLMLSSSNLLVICIIIFNICNLHCMNLEWAEFLFSICAAYVNCNSHCLTFKSFSQSVISFAWFSALCFHRSSMFLYAQLMLRICSVEILVIRYELFCGLAWWSWHMLRIDFEAFPTRRQILNVRGICYLSSSTRRQEIFPTPAQLFQPPGELHPLLGRVRTCLKHVFWLSSLG